MSKAIRHRVKSRAAVILAWTLVSSLAVARTSAAQVQPLLEITSPAPGTIVNPGQTITATVTSPAGASFQMVGVVGEDPFPSSDDFATSVPAQFSLTVPADISSGTYMLTATGVTSSGHGTDSARILIEVEVAQSFGL